MNLLWINAGLLLPLDKGGKLRTWHLMRQLARRHDISYLSFADQSTTAADVEGMRQVASQVVTIPRTEAAKGTARFHFEAARYLVDRVPYAIAKYRSAAYRRAIEQLLTTRRFDAIVCDFLVPAVNLPDTLPCPTILFTHNVESEIWRRHVENARNPISRRLLTTQWRRMQRFERSALGRFDLVLAVSDADRQTFGRLFPEALSGPAHVVQTGVDTSFFAPPGQVPKRAHLVFTGSMDWLPNEDGIRYFVESVLPLIKQTIPGVRLTVVGRNPSKSLVELSQRDPSIIVTGRVDDVRGYIEKAAAYIVPLRIGGGTRLKIYEAMAMEKPVISTSIGAEGLPVNNGSDVILADTAETFAAGVVELLTDPQLARDIGLRAAKKVREQFGWKQVARNFAELCEETVKRKSA